MSIDLALIKTWDCLFQSKKFELSQGISLYFKSKTQTHQLLDELNTRYKWDKIFKSGPNKICGRQPLKHLKGYGLLSRPYPFNFFKGCLPQILLGPLLNTLFQMLCPID